MAYFTLIHFEQWDEQAVAGWLKGLDDAVQPYISHFVDEEIDGKKLLMLTHSDLDKLGVTKLGHQELILEGVDLLKLLRYTFETENLQHLALQLGCKARSLHNEILARNGENDPNRANVTQSRRRQLSVSILSSVCDIMLTLKTLTSWLDRAPFETSHGISLLRNSIVKLGLELVTVAQKESGVSEVEQAIVKTCQGMAEYCDGLVINMKESLVVQPASLELATIRKKQGDELGMNIQSSYSGIHAIGCIKEMSPADLCSKIEKGDEVLQVNNQTVLGWQLAKLVAALKEKPKEVTMLLKKRPRHSNPFGNLPNKRQINNKHVPPVATLPKRRSRDGEKVARPTLEYVTSSVPTGDIYITKESPEDNIDTNDDTDNDVFRSGSESPQFTLPVIPADAKQRRATVSGGSPTFERPSLVVEDLDPAPVRPKSQAINQAERDAAIAALLAADNSLYKKPTEEKEKKRSLSDSEETAGERNAVTLQVIDPPKLNEVDNTQEPTQEDVSSVTAGDTETNTVPDQVLKNQDTLTSDNQGQEAEHEADDKVQEFTVTKPTPVLREGSHSSARKSWNRQQKIISMEVAGESGTQELPKLMRMRRLDSDQIRDWMEDDDVFGPKPHKKVAFSEETKKQESFAHIVVGGVVQKIPVAKTSSSESVILRSRSSGSKTRVNRRISCKDLGRGDCEGWLYKRKQKDRTLSKHWVKRWCVLKNHDFFYFKQKDDLKAEGVISLPAFQVSPASLMKTKKFAFKIHNAGTTFYFASERQDDMGKWMNKMGLAAISYDRGGNLVTVKPSVSSEQEVRNDYSESDDEGDEMSDFYGSVQSVNSIGSTSSPQISPLVRRHQLQEVKENVGMSTEALHSMLRSIETENLTIDGKDKRKQRVSHCMASRELPAPVDPAELEKMRRLHSLQRTLRAKELELQEIERLMSKPVTGEDLSQFADVHLEPQPTYL